MLLNGCDTTRGLDNLGQKIDVYTPRFPADTGIPTAHLGKSTSKYCKFSKQPIGLRETCAEATTAIAEGERSTRSDLFRPPWISVSRARVRIRRATVQNTAPSA